MESMDKVIDTIMDKKKGYDYDGDDFAAPTELMVSITLHEYRNLVASNARIREENSKLTVENNKLKAEAAALSQPRQLKRWTQEDERREGEKEWQEMQELEARRKAQDMDKKEW